MRALITGASSGIGLEFASKLVLTHDLILVARRIDLLEKFKSQYPNASITIHRADLNNKEEVESICSLFPDIDLLINNAGLGNCAEFVKTEDAVLDNMLNVNIIALHILTKFYLTKFYEKNNGSILNVASVAAYQPGPLMSTYYASKAFVLNLSVALAIEAKKASKNVYVGCLCPGPTRTEFNDVANVEFSKMMKSHSASYVVDYCLKNLGKKIIIIPSFKLKVFVFTNRFLSKTFVSKIVYKFQKSKIN